MPALSRGVHPDHFVSTAFSFLNPKQTSWFSPGKNFAQLLSAWEAEQYHGCKIWIRMVLICTAAQLSLCDLIFKANLQSTAAKP